MIVQRILPLILLLFAYSGVLAQVTNDRYRTSYNGNDISNVSILHHAPMWYDFRKDLTEQQKATDTFDDASDGFTQTLNGINIQVAHTYVDTIYMHKGTSIDIMLPYTINGGQMVLRNYFRWFDFRTEGTFNCNISRNNSTIYDLLTPTQSNVVAYRFVNGYVSGIFNDNTGNRDTDDDGNGNSRYKLRDMTFYYPTDDEIRDANANGFNQGDNSYYVLACDVSSYKDFASGEEDRRDARVFDFGANGEYNEPTLSGRTIFYIIGVEDEIDDVPEDFEHHWSLLNEAYHGGNNRKNLDGEDLDYYLEEYEITFPSRRTSNFTEEVVALSKCAYSYAIPGLSNNQDGDNLSIKMADNDNTAGLSLSTESLSGTSRVILFHKTGINNGRSWVVDDGSTATILVTKIVNNTTYNIARFRLKFKEEVTPLTQTQVANLKNLQGNEGYWWENLTYRSPEYLEENYKLLTSITFDYDPDLKSSDIISNGISDYYLFPIDWASSSYAFYGGLPHDDTVVQTNCDFPNYGEYGIVNTCVRDSYNDIIPKNLGKNTDNYWMYVDASEAPGALVRLKFDENLCQGSKLIVTAWMKSLGNFDSSYDAAVLLTIMGVEVDSDGNEKYTPIYRQNSSQIRKTMYLTDGQDGNNLGSEVTGKGNNTNEWFQIYLSFINDGNTDYDYYVLSVNNSCAYSNGGDYYFDEVKVYIEHPKLEMEQIYPICTTSENKSLMRMDLDYETMMSRLGFDSSEYIGDENNNATASIDFVIIDKAKYYNAIAGDNEPSKEQKEEAFKAALVTFYDSQEKEHQLPTLDFYLNYELNLKYNDSEPGNNQVVFGNNNDDDEGDFFYRETENNTIKLSMDCYSDMMAYTTYILLLEPHTETAKEDAQKLDEFIALLDDVCAISIEFYLTSTTILKINGETVNPMADYCAGQEFVISPEVTYIDENGNTVYLDGEYFDWFFGSVEEYTVANDTYGGISLEEALIAFRTYYPDVEVLSEIETPPTGENGVDGAFTQNHYDIIEYYLGQMRYGGMNNMLVLHKSHLDMRILSTGLELVIQPIKVDLNDEEGEELMICFGYVPLTLMSSGDAPSLKVGFYNINYPEDDYEPCLRLGLAQMEKCSESTPFTINLCKATYVTEAGVDIDHLGVAEGMDMLFLVDSDDPAYHEMILGKEDGDEIVIGKVARLYATSDESNDPRGDAPSNVTGSYLQIYFYGDEDEVDGVTPFTVKEGYYYVLSVYFQEKGSFDDGEQAVGSACWGTFPLEIKVVPEYLVWTGDKTYNWNNDSHWRRADKSELNKQEADAYISNTENGTDNGFVPMLFSKVIMPKDSEAELYMAGFILDETMDSLEWIGDSDEAIANHDDVSEHPTGNIMYDMMLYDKEDIQGNLVSLKTEHYRVNLCDEIHFESGAKLLHSEQLIYNKAWTDVEISGGKWLLTATPLKGVVSGDWYTKKASGTETSEYFRDITFNLSENDRYEPEVYQRSWSRAGSIYSNSSTEDRTTPSYVSTGWSSTYNDTFVPYQTGEGFSIKTYWGEGNEDVCFRFPKADETYQYQEGASSSLTGDGTKISRENSGKLLISDLVDRSDPERDDDGVYSEDVTVDLTQTSNAYYIIGNPFTAHMSMKEFLKENTQFKGYWLESTYGPIAGTLDGTSWGTEDCQVEPYSAFFVTMDENDLTRAYASPTVTFTKDMQTLEEEDEVEKTSFVAFSVRATSEVGTTAASLSYSKEAIDGYKTAEDAVLMEDVTWKKDGMPLVYTVAGNMAVSVNKLNALTLIPLGCFAGDDLEYILTFVGVRNLNEPSLYDAYTNTDTPLTEGYTLEIKGETHGRYFIRSKSPSVTSIDEIDDVVYSMLAYSPTKGTIVVSAEAGIETLEVYSLSGILLGKANVGGNITCTLDEIESGIAIVRARTFEGTFVKKIRVK